MRWLMMGYAQDDERVQALEQAGQTVDTAEAGDNETWQSAARTQYDGIWVRWAEVDHAIRPLVQYRSMRPLTRILVEIPDDLTPPNSELAQWVALGIYDIVRSSTGTESVLRTVATIADALSWTGFQSVDHGGQVGEGQAVKPVIEFRTIEKVVEKRIAASSRPVLIAVVGVAPGVGTTSTAVEVARTLASMGHDTALVESRNALAALSRWESELPSGITVFASPAPDPLELVRRREWPYIVVDGGAIGAWSEITTWQADLSILAGPGDRRRFGRWEPLVRSMPTDYTGGIVGGAVIGGKDGQVVVEGLETDGNLPAAFVLSSNTKKADKALKSLLAPVLGEGKGRRWWRKSYVPPAVEAPKPSTKDPEWRYTPSNSSPPSAIPYVPPTPTPTVNVQIGRGRRSGLARLWYRISQGAVLWLGASCIAWFLVLASSPGSGIPINPGRWLIWAQWMTAVNGHLLSLLSRL